MEFFEIRCHGFFLRDLLIKLNLMNGLFDFGQCKNYQMEPGERE